MKLKNSLNSTILLFATLLLTFPNEASAQNPHPILRNFSGNVIGEIIRLNWTVTGGSTCSGIRIQRSGDGQFFQDIGEIDGICGSPDSDIPYVFQDSTPLVNQVNYYRLELGSQGYSTPIALRYAALNSLGYSLTYDMLNKKAIIYFDNSNNSQVEYQLISMTGTHVLSNTCQCSSIELELSGYAAQIFLLSIRINNSIIPVKIPAF